MSLERYRYFLMIGVIITGAFNTICKGAENRSYSTGIDGERVKFKKPWTQTAFMFLGELTALLYYHVEKRRAESRVKSGKVPLLEGVNGTSETTVEKPPSAPFYLFLPPAFLDLFGTALGSVGLLYVNPSVWQMLRGCSIIFSAILSVIFLKRKLYSFNYVGIFITFIGLGIVGVSSILGSSDSGVDSSAGEMLFGFLMLGIGLLCNSAQLIVEELFLKKRAIPPALVVGSEGAWGCMGMVVVLAILYAIPGNDKGSYENAYDSAVMIYNNNALLCFVIGQYFCLWLYNVIALNVTKSLSAIHRTVLDAFRTTFVWGINLFIYYAIDSGYGEKLNEYSWVQGIGFCFLILGTLVFNRLVDLPCIKYDGDVGKMTATAAPDAASPKVDTSSDSNQPIDIVTSDDTKSPY